MTRAQSPPTRPLRVALGPFVQPSTWHTVSYSLLSLPLGIVSFTVTFTALALAGSLVITLVLSVAIAAVFVPAVFLAARVERWRAELFLGEHIPAARRAPHGEARFLRRLWIDVRSAAFWKTVAYLLLLLPVGVFAFVLVLGLFAAALALLAAPAFVPALPEEQLDFWLFTAGSAPELAAVFVTGLVLSLVAVWSTRALRRFQLSFVRTFLGTTLAEEVTTLGARVDVLAETRARVVDATELERRRIERDLHDGTQQRLVSLAMQLGMAKEKLDTDPDAARALIDDAHSDAKQTLAELRDLVRGIHPPLLTERGLTAAVESLAARAGFTVVVDSHLDCRLTDSIESTAYFVVSECLANVAKHAPGAAAWVLIRCEEDPLRPGTGTLAIEVGDNGPGGVVERPDGGIAGLRTRVAAVDGTLQVSSPPDGPTTVVVRMPCSAKEN
jgi:signal transduction histidine kinase